MPRFLGWAIAFLLAFVAVALMAENLWYARYASPYEEKAAFGKLARAVDEMIAGGEEGVDIEGGYVQSIQALEGYVRRSHPEWVRDRPGVFPGLLTEAKYTRSGSPATRPTDVLLASQMVHERPNGTKWQFRLLADGTVLIELEP